jgi:drug/metabolite transporter (DMT)-like permease
MRLDAFVVNGLRAVFGLLILIPLTLLTGGAADVPLLTLSRLAYLAGAVFMGGVLGDALYVFSLKALGVGRAFPIANSFPLYTIVLSTLLLDTEITWPMILGGGLVLFGVYLVARPRRTVLRSETPLDSAQLATGVVMAFGAALLWAGTSVAMAVGLRDSINAPLATAARVPVMVLACFAASASRGTLVQVRKVDRHTWLLLALSGFVGWGLAATLYSAAIQRLGPSLTAIIGATSPIFAVPMSLVFLGERPTRHTLLGTVISVVGIALVL